MNIHEYQAKNIIKEYGINIPAGVLISNKEDIDNIINNFDSTVYVIKAQIHAGDRAKSGGVKIAYTKDTAKKIANEMLGINLITKQTNQFGQKVNKLYLESFVETQKQYYLSILFDRNLEKITIMAFQQNYNEESLSKLDHNKLIKVVIDPMTGLQDFHCRNISLMLSLNHETAKQMNQLIESLYKIFITYEATLIELSPLVLSKYNKLVALDAKMIFDDNALFRHKNIRLLRDISEEDEQEAIASNMAISYVKMDGNIGCIVNGSGLAMATIDLVHMLGGNPANFLDIGGQPGNDKIKNALQILLLNKAIKVILINIFGGMMRCDHIANNIITVSKAMEIKIPIILRLEGTNSDMAKNILANSNLAIIVASDLKDAVKQAINYSK
jgi:succinyl-CoA synthetase beta subunit